VYDNIVFVYVLVVVVLYSIRTYPTAPTWTLNATLPFRSCVWQDNNRKLNNVIYGRLTTSKANVSSMVYFFPILLYALCWVGFWGQKHSTALAKQMNKYYSLYLLCRCILGWSGQISTCVFWNGWVFDLLILVLLFTI
jgi:hypothetical protein